MKYSNDTLIYSESKLFKKAEMLGTEMLATLEYSSYASRRHSRDADWPFSIVAYSLNTEYNLTLFLQT